MSPEENSKTSPVEAITLACEWFVAAGYRHHDTATKFGNLVGLAVSHPDNRFIQRQLRALPFLQLVWEGVAVNCLLAGIVNLAKASCVTQGDVLAQESRTLWLAYGINIDMM